MDRPAVDTRRTVKAFAATLPLEDGFFPDYSEPGAIEVLQGGTHLVNACPGCGRVSAIRVGNPKPVESPSWGIEGGSLDDVTKLTLRPSMNCTPCCGWHGYLTDGVFAPC